MKIIPSVHSRSYTTRRVARLARYSTVALTMTGLLLAVPIAFGQTNHPPTISWLSNQRDSFSKQYFRISDKETPLTANSISVDSTNDDFTDHIGITWGVCTSGDRSNGCPSDGGYYIDFPHAPGNTSDPSATVKIKVTDGVLDATSSFTLRKDSAIEPPTIAGIPNEEIVSASDVRYGPVWFVVGDLDSAGADDAVDSAGNSMITFEKSSDNTNLMRPKAPTLSWLGDFRDSFTRQYIRIGDKETSLTITFSAAGA